MFNFSCVLIAYLLQVTNVIWSHVKNILLKGILMFDIALRTAAKKVLGLIKMEEIFFDWRRFFLMLGSGRLS